MQLTNDFRFYDFQKNMLGIYLTAVKFTSEPNQMQIYAHVVFRWTCDIVELRISKILHTASATLCAT